MTLRCADCGKFIGYGQSYLTEIEPLSEFGPERISFVHTACEAKAIEARRAATTGAVEDESAVRDSGFAQTPTGDDA